MIILHSLHGQNEDNVIRRSYDDFLYKNCKMCVVFGRL